jgi:excisionase family DNA binding protein
MENLIVQKLNNIEKMLQEQNLQHKEVLNIEDACKYLDISRSHLYKLTSTKQIPHYCPQGKRLYFKKSELENWLLRNRSNTSNEMDETAINYVISNPRR